VRQRLAVLVFNSTVIFNVDIYMPLDLYFMPTMITAINSRMRWVWFVVRTREVINSFKRLVVKTRRYETTCKT
jgi:hypothetical protein